MKTAKDVFSTRPELITPRFKRKNFHVQKIIIPNAKLPKNRYSPFTRTDASKQHLEIAI